MSVLHQDALALYRLPIGVLNCRVVIEWRNEKKTHGSVRQLLKQRRHRLLFVPLRISCIKWQALILSEYFGRILLSALFLADWSFAICTNPSSCPVKRRHARLHFLHTLPPDTKFQYAAVKSQLLLKTKCGGRQCSRQIDADILSTCNKSDERIHWTKSCYIF